MRPLLGGIGLSLLALIVGCNLFNPQPSPVDDQRTKWGGTPPKPEDLVSWLNRNAQQVQSIEAKKAFVKAKQEGEQPLDVETYIACQKAARPDAKPNFRLMAFVIGNTEVDVGSNSDEFWFWIKRSPRPYVFHCAYADYPKAAARGAMPFPFQPEWVVEALGIAEYDPNLKYEVNSQSKATYDLVQRTKSAKGDDVVKVIAFHKVRQPGKSPVAAYILYEPTGNAKQPYREICSAVIDDSQVVTVGGKSVALPSKVHMRCLREKTELTVDLGKTEVNVAWNQERQTELFTRRALNNLRSFDLARGEFDNPGDVRQAGGRIR